MTRGRWLLVVGIAALVVAHVVLLHRVSAWIAIPASIATAGIVVAVVAHVGVPWLVVRRRRRAPPDPE